MLAARLLVFSNGKPDIKILDRYNANLNLKFVDRTAEVERRYQRDMVKAIKRTGETFLIPYRRDIPKMSGFDVVDLFPANQVYCDRKAFAVCWLGMDCIHGRNGVACIGENINVDGKFIELYEPVPELFLPIYKKNPAPYAKCSDVVWDRVENIRAFVDSIGRWNSLDSYLPSLRGEVYENGPVDVKGFEESYKKCRIDSQLSVTVVGFSV